MFDDRRGDCHATSTSSCHAVQLLASRCQRRRRRRRGRGRQRRSADRPMACLHQSFSVAAASAAESSCGSFSTTVASTRSMGGAWTERGCDVRGLEQLHVAGFPPRISERCRHAAHDRRRTRQEAHVDRYRRGCHGSRTRHIGCKSQSMVRRCRLADNAPPGPARRKLATLRMAVFAQAKKSCRASDQMWMSEIHILNT
jgi:hypothetical protein